MGRAVAVVQWCSPDTWGGLWLWSSGATADVWEAIMGVVLAVCSEGDINVGSHYFHRLVHLK